MKTLVAYYSGTGITEKWLKPSRDGFHLTLMRSSDERSGRFVWLRASRKEAVLKKGADIRTTKVDPSRYDLTIIGTPVRVQIVSSPVRADISRNSARFIRVAFFCAQDRSGAQSAFEEMRVSSGRDSVGALEILNEEVEDNSNGKKLSGLSRAS